MTGTPHGQSLSRCVRTAVFGLTTAVALALAIGAAGCSLITNFDDDRDGGAGDDGGGGGADAIPADFCNNLEPNDSIGLPSQIAAGTIVDLAICPVGDNDFFQFTLADGEDVVITALFTLDGQFQDLDMRLFDSGATSIDLAATFDANEVISHTAAEGNALPSGVYTIQVFGASAGVQNDYVLTLDITPAM